jgi:hypothetical protein
MPDNDSAGGAGNKTSFNVPVPTLVTSGGSSPTPAPIVNSAGQVNRSPESQRQYANDPTAAARMVAQQQGGRDSSGSWGGQSTAVSDVFSQLVGYVTGHQDTGRLVTGLIHDGTAIANNYVVHPDHGTGPIIATAMTHTSSGAYGPTEFNGYIPGTRVVVMLQDKDNKNFILGAIPQTLDCGKRGFQDTISQGSRNRVDDAHKKHLKQEKSCNMADYSNWRPYDATLGGEWGAMTTGGSRVSIDDFMVQIGVNEFCGLYGFYHDNLLRIAGYNMQVWTAGSERDSYMDQAECNDSQGYTPYPWEGMGVLQPGIEVIEEYEPGCFQCFEQKPYYSRWENKHEFAQPYHRSQVFFGYLGQGMRQLVHAPPFGLQRWTYKGVPSGPGETPYDSKIEPRRNEGSLSYNCEGGPDKLKDHQAQPVYGLSEENKALDGRIFMASAKGVHISKRILLPFPQRIKRPEDYKNGDEAEKNYKAASKFGAGPEHDITGTIKTTDTEYPNLQRAAALLDLHGYLYNYSGLHAFYWHAKDYKTWEQQELPYAKTNQKIPKFGRLTGKMYLKEETPVPFWIDHRYNKKGQQKFYETESFISLLEDGGVVIGDGYGGEIRMTGGCVIISAPGDVWLKGGRDVQAWAGNDVIARANKSVDISSTEKNIRIKAERNILVLAGNDSSEEEGGILLESRSKTTMYNFEECGDNVMFGGIVLRAPHSNVVNLAKDIYLRTGGGEVEQGIIFLDASKGDQDIVTKSQNMHHFVKEDGRVYQYFGGQEIGGATKANVFSKELNLLCENVSVGKNLFVNGFSLHNESIFVHFGHIFTQMAAKGTTIVLPCEGECETKVGEALSKFEEMTNQTIPEAGNKVDEGLSFQWYLDNCAGNDRVMTIMEFSFRKDDEYKIPDFVLYEDRWQQMARLGGETVEQWTERAVTSKVCSKTYPFPGKKWLEDKPAYKEQDFKIVQIQDGYIDKERGPAPGLAAEYKDPEFKQPKEKIINGYYPIIPRT